MSEKKLTTRIQQKTDTKANWDKATNFVPLKGEYIYYSDLHKVKVGDGITKVGSLPFLADSDTHQSIKTLNTNNTAAQTPSANESIAGSGTINLHKVAKTGSYNDLNNKPDLSAYQSKGDYVLAKNGSIVVSNDGTKFTAGYVDDKTGEAENVLWISGSGSSFGYNNILLSILPGATRPNVWVKNENNEWETYDVICTPDVYTKTESDEKYQSKGSYATLDGNGKVPLSQLPSYVGTITSVTAGSGISIETSDDGTVKISCSYSDGDMETY